MVAEDYKQTIDEIVRKIAEKFNPLKIILFGSYAYGSPTKDSDIDLLIIKESIIPRHQRTKEVRRILRGMKVAVDILVYTPEEVRKWEGIDTAFITGVLKKGKVLYG
ncbi:MAG: nucleotidyltransferase domain-containing protein [Nitrospirae bacterium]|nr:nucleotidyltransferase domain-containing protein [Nitrospirota bacterium]